MRVGEPGHIAQEPKLAQCDVMRDPLDSARRTSPIVFIQPVACPTQLAACFLLEAVRGELFLVFPPSFASFSAESWRLRENLLGLLGGRPGSAVCSCLRLGCDPWQPFPSVAVIASPCFLVNEQLPVIECFSSNCSGARPRPCC